MANDSIIELSIPILRDSSNKPERDVSKCRDVASVWRDDISERINFALQLRDFVRVQDRSLSIGLNAPWGGGKTFFLKRFVRTFVTDNESKPANSRKSPVLYLNAWADDYIKDPFIFLFTEIVEQLVKNGFLAADIGEEIRGRVLRIAGLTAFRSINAVIDAKASGTCSVIQNLIGRLWPSIVSICGYGPQNAGRRIRRALSEETADLKYLKEKLSAAIKNVKTETDYPLVVCVDELDRCRPTYAIELLERVKHLFEIDGIVFIFAIDNENLGRSIQSVYGEIDTDEYLRRFIQINIELPPPSIWQFWGLMWETRGIPVMLEDSLRNNHIDIHGNDYDELIQSMMDVGARLVERAGLTYRQTQDLVIRYIQSALSSSFEFVTEYFLLLIIAIIKVKAPSLITKLKDDNPSSVEKLNKLFNIGQEMTDVLGHAIKMLIEWSTIKSGEKLDQYRKDVVEPEIDAIEHGTYFNNEGPMIVHCLKRDIGKLPKNFLRGEYSHSRLELALHKMFLHNVQVNGFIASSMNAKFDWSHLRYFLEEQRKTESEVQETMNTEKKPRQDTLAKSIFFGVTISVLVSATLSLIGAGGFLELNGHLPSIGLALTALFFYFGYFYGDVVIGEEENKKNLPFITIGWLCFVFQAATIKWIGTSVVAFIAGLGAISFGMYYSDGKRVLKSSWFMQNVIVITVFVVFLLMWHSSQQIKGCMSNLCDCLSMINSGVALCAIALMSLGLFIWKLVKEKPIKDDVVASTSEKLDSDASMDMIVPQDQQK